MRLRYQNLDTELYIDRFELHFIWQGRYSTLLEMQAQIQAAEHPRTGSQGIHITHGPCPASGGEFTHRDFRNTFSYFSRKFCLLSLQIAPRCKSAFIYPKRSCIICFFTYHLRAQISTSPSKCMERKMI